MARPLHSQAQPGSQGSRCTPTSPWWPGWSASTLGEQQSELVDGTLAVLRSVGPCQEWHI